MLPVLPLRFWREGLAWLCPPEVGEWFLPAGLGGSYDSNSPCSFIFPFPALCRVHLPGAGSFRCSETELGLEVRAAVTVQYRYGFWDQHLSVWSTPKWMIAGPLFSIQAEPAGAVAAIHLPHFLWADTSRIQIAHFIEEGMTLEKPMQVRPFHAVLENPSFSLYGVVWGNRSKPPVLIHSIVLLYWALKMAKTTLHLYIIPNDHSRFKVTENQLQPTIGVSRPIAESMA
uniref:FIIND domain-containing protein n=1 Tax=Terrapene triunguis TaxID=2587831 RepID=A0A674IW10_9SAUR